MIIDIYKDISGFPFCKYYENMQQYCNAQRYWYSLIRSCEYFADEGWYTFFAPLNMPDDQIVGKMYWIRNHKLKKEIILHTSSYRGAVCVHMGDNQWMGEEAAEKEVKTYYSDFTAWVEASDYFHDDTAHSEGGYYSPIERLHLTSEISEQVETKAIHALNLFLQPGPAIERVNSIFFPNEEL